MNDLSTLTLLRSTERHAFNYLLRQEGERVFLADAAWGFESEGLAEGHEVVEPLSAYRVGDEVEIRTKDFRESGRRYVLERINNAILVLKDFNTQDWHRNAVLVLKDLDIHYWHCHPTRLPARKPGDASNTKG